MLHLCALYNCCSRHHVYVHASTYTAFGHRLCAFPLADGLREAVRYLLIAESDYATLQCFKSLANVQYLLSVVYHNLGLEKQRDDAATRHMTTDEARKKVEAVAVDEQVKRIWEVVSQVGAALAAR
jgi:anaphase-promoting complex subunit 5